MRPRRETEAKIEILDASGKVIRKYSSAEFNTLDEPLDPDDKKPEKQIKPDAGLNRFVWDLRYEEARHVPGYYLVGIRRRRARARWRFLAITRFGSRLGSQTQTAAFDLKLDPRVKVSQADLEQQFNLLIANARRTEPRLRYGQSDPGCAFAAVRLEEAIAGECRRENDRRGG